MGPLVYYCRWRGSRLRLRGRDEAAVWGELVGDDEDPTRVEPFRFDLKTWELWLGEEPARRLQLDELGVVLSEDAPGATTKADAAPQ
jgi:hypothetical protein